MRPVKITIETERLRVDPDGLQCTCAISVPCACNATIEFAPVNIHLDLFPDAAPFRCVMPINEKEETCFTLFIQRYPEEGWGQNTLWVTITQTEIAFERLEDEPPLNIVPLDVTYNGENIVLPNDTRVVSSAPHRWR